MKCSPEERVLIQHQLRHPIVPDLQVASCRKPSIDGDCSGIGRQQFLGNEHLAKHRVSLDEDTHRRQELNVLHLTEKRATTYRSKSTGNEMLWYIDSKKCTGCGQCVLACAFAKSMKYSPIQSRIYVKRMEPKGWSIPVVCEHCTEPPCAMVCPVYAISRSEETGIVSVDLEKCTGCTLCRYACPWGKETIRIMKVEGYRGSKAIKCDLCGGEPTCAKVCVVGALQWVEPNQDGPALKWKLSSIRARDIAEMEVEVCH